MTDDDWVSVYRPLLPPADAVAAYIRQSDAARFYANRGPLVCQLEARLSEAFGHPGDHVRLTASGTAAIEAAILALAGPARPEKPVALLPSYTFATSSNTCIARFFHRIRHTPVNALSVLRSNCNGTRLYSRMK